MCRRCTCPHPPHPPRPNAKNPRDLDISITYQFSGKHGEVHRTQAYRMR
jgi:protein arginine N-methyltransferase 1